MKASSFAKLLFPLVGILMAGGDEAPAMEFRHEITESGFTFIDAHGEVEPGDAVRLKRYIERFKLGRATIALDSVGGSVAESIYIGQFIRSAQLSTLVSRQCVSACAFAFMGGINRHILDGAKLGVHQFSWDSSGMDTRTAIGDSQMISAEILDYAVEMGVDVKAVTIGMTVSTHQMYIFSNDELRKYRLVTDGTITMPDGPWTDPDCPFPDEFVVHDPLGLYPGCENAIR